MNPADILAAAREMLARPVAAGAGSWQRAVALLTRQALEQALEQFWEADPATLPLAAASGKTQLTCLPMYLQSQLAREISYVWAALSSACHYHPYDLAPTATELTGWIDAVGELIAALADRAPSS